MLPINSQQQKQWPDDNWLLRGPQRLLLAKILRATTANSWRLLASDVRVLTCQEHLKRRLQQHHLHAQLPELYLCTGELIYTGRVAMLR